VRTPTIKEMPWKRTIAWQPLLHFVTRIIQAPGTPPDIAEVVAQHLVNADLKGYTSHGVYHLSSYMQKVDQQEISPTARPEIIRQSASTAAVEGHNGWGQYIALWCMQIAIEKARATGLGGVTLAHSSHIGRLGEFVEYAAEHGCIGLILRGGGGVGSGNALPYGGAQGALGSNPVAMSVPSADGKHFVGDFATTVFSNGKMQMARMTGATLPPGAIVDKHGQPSTDPAAFFDGGSHLVFGGYKGYALSLLACMAGGLAGTYNAATRRMSGTYFQAISIEAFQPPEQYQEAVSAFLGGMRSVPPAEGFSEVVTPGDLARRNEERQRREGIAMPRPVWEKLVALGEKYQVDWPGVLVA
jgi:uncharacterized oxidoreductase